MICYYLCPELSGVCAMFLAWAAHIFIIIQLKIGGIAHRKIILQLSVITVE